MAKKFEIAVKTGVYRDSSGVEKGQYSNLGTVHTGREKDQFFAVLHVSEMLLLAHRAIVEGNTVVTASFFTPRDSSSQAKPAKSEPSNDDFNDIPF